MTNNYAVFYNDDGSSMGSDAFESPVESHREWVDRVLDHIDVDVYTLSLALPDIVFYPSAAGETLGQRFARVEDIESEHLRAWSRCVRALDALGTDPIAVVGEHVRARGAAFFAEIRVSDTHHMSADLSYPLCPQFSMDHPEWRIQRNDTLPDGVEEMAMDYSFPEVRAHRLAIVRELAARPEIDGFELNFIRWGKNFIREEAFDKAHVMTEFIGQIRQILDDAAAARGSARLPLAMRVPSTVAECLAGGLDPAAWLANGCMDYLIVSDFNYSDPQLPVEEFATITAGTECKLLAQMGDMIGGTWQGKPSMKDRERGLAIFADHYHGLLNTDAEARATACNAYAWGADGISFWNICVNMGDVGSWCGPDHRARMLGWMNAVRDMKTALQGPRHYHYMPLYKWLNTPLRNYAVNRQYHSPLGGQHCRILTFDSAQNGTRQVYPFRMADGRNGEALTGTLRFPIFNLALDDDITIDINGEPVENSCVRRHGRPSTDPPVTIFVLALADCPAFRGHNELGLTVSRVEGDGESPYMEELELIVADDAT